MAIAILDMDQSAPEAADILLQNQCAIRLLRTPPSCLALLANEPPDILMIVLKHGLRDERAGDGELAGRRELYDVMRQAVALHIEVWLMGRGHDDDLARKAVALGACGYLSYPLAPHTLLAALGIKPSAAMAPAEASQDAADNLLRSLLLSNASAMQHVYRQIKRAAPTRAAVLITGESGTGKDMSAQAIHRLSQRAERPFIAVNCGAISPQLIESELFGHEKGSFTGAIREHRGYFERAHGGTLFLDEITEMPLELQANLLRILETQRFSRLGSTREMNCDIRLITACNRDPRQAVTDGYLREDLLYRIQVFPIHMPPLRCREGDVELLARHFLEAHNRSGGVLKRFSPQAMAALVRYPWPGNIRELRNIVYRAYLMADTTIDLADLPPQITSPCPPAVGDALTVSVGSTLAEMEEKLISATLKHCRGNREKAAKMLGVSTKTLYNRLRTYRQRRKTDSPSHPEVTSWRDDAGH